VPGKNPQNTSDTPKFVAEHCPLASDEPRLSKRRRVAPAQYHGLLMYDRRLQDILPEPAPALLPPSTPSSSNPEPLPVSAAQPTPIAPVTPPGLGTLDTPTPCTDSSTDTMHNVFGMFQRYYGQKLPAHDPGREASLASLSNIPSPPRVPETQEPSKMSDFHPYPNQSSFLLADWYWNHGLQKSHESFKKLLSIVGNIDFLAQDVHETNWNQINCQLAINDWDEGAWVDEDVGWQRSAISIRVPFHCFLDYPGVQNYTIPNFYHRSLTSVIWE
jgi:hypothetical protein